MSSSMLPFGLDWTRSCPSSQGFFWRNSPRVRPLRCGGIGVNGTHVSVLSLSLSLSLSRSGRSTLLLSALSDAWRIVKRAHQKCQKRRAGALFGGLPCVRRGVWWRRGWAWGRLGGHPLAGRHESTRVREKPDGATTERGAKPSCTVEGRETG